MKIVEFIENVGDTQGPGRPVLINADHIVFVQPTGGADHKTVKVRLATGADLTLRGSLAEFQAKLGGG